MKTTLVKKMVTVTIFLVGAATGFGGYVLGQQKQAPEVRRVVTKLDESGKAVVMIDERTRLTAPRPPNAAANVWITDKSLPDFSWSDDRGKTKIGLVPPKSGTVFRVVDFAPESAPGEQTFWERSDTGTGTRTLEWQLSTGDWTVVVMNATVRMRIARTKFMKTPAARTIACAHHGLEVNDRGSPVPC